MNKEPRAITSDELCNQVISHIKLMAWYWANLKDKTDLEKCEGTAFSILTMLDGCTMLPAFDLVAQPHESDKAFCIENDENWIEPGTTISTMLHERFHGK
jgi:hypothetical protein